MKISIFVIVIAAAILIAVMAVMESADKAEIEQRLIAAKMEHAYLAGWNDGFGLCSDINSGLLPDPKAAAERQAAMQKKFLSEIGHK